MPIQRCAWSALTEKTALFTGNEALPVIVILHEISGFLLQFSPSSRTVWNLTINGEKTIHITPSEHKPIMASQYLMSVSLKRCVTVFPLFAMWSFKSREDPQVCRDYKTINIRACLKNFKCCNKTELWVKREVTVIALRSPDRSFHSSGERGCKCTLV